MFKEEQTIEKVDEREKTQHNYLKYRSCLYPKLQETLNVKEAERSQRPPHRPAECSPSDNQHHASN